MNAVEDWLKVQRSLIAEECRFARTAERFAAGQATRVEMGAAHEAVLSLRLLAEEVLASVLATGPPST